MKTDKNPRLISQTNASHQREGNHDQIVDAIFAALGVEASEFVAIPIATEIGIDSDEEKETWILHVDDDADFRAAVKIRLQQYGITVVNAIDGRDGIRQALRHPASAILLDYEMPNGQGDYVIHRLKENESTKDIPIIVLTGVRDKFLERRLLSMGATSYFTKPPNFETLLEEIEKHAPALSRS